MKTYPIFLIGLEARRCLVFGGGSEAERKIAGLLECDASVTVISPEVTGPIREHAAEGRITWVTRDYTEGDLAGAFLVVATETGRPDNERIFAEARSRGTLINVCDETRLCNFIAGAVHRQGSLSLAISTGGCAPALAVRIRQRLEAQFGPEYGQFLSLMEELREELALRVPDFEARRRLWYRLVDSDILDSLRTDPPERVRRKTRQLVRRISRRPGERRPTRATIP